MRIRTGTKRWGLALAAAAGLVAVGVTRLEAQGQVTMFDGSTLYRTYCASCHGTGGRGDGPVAQHLKKPPANLTQIAVRNNGVFEAAKVGQFIDGRNVAVVVYTRRQHVINVFYSPAVSATETKAKAASANGYLP